MTDFLTRLIERSRGMSAAVQPRMPSMFAPLPDPVRRDQGLQEEHSEIAVGGDRSQALEILPSGRFPPRPQDDGIAGDRRRLSPPRPRPEADVRAGPGHPRGPNELAQVGPHSPRDFESAGRLSEMDGAPRSAQSSPAVPSQVRWNGDEPGENRQRPQPATVSGVRPRPSEESWAASSPLVTTGPVPAPVVRVTIGQIEIRAVHAPPESPRSRTAPPGPVLTLADYLAQRREGRR
jgi:hypothetical protein